ncbi:MAG: hypothetical protein NUW08_04090 [Candidatus Uhrbacteria bacterium]|nr:hypothetical protein [Candidatus Uhrbacteria bacterium]
MARQTPKSHRGTSSAPAGVAVAESLFAECNKLASQLEAPGLLELLPGGTIEPHTAVERGWASEIGDLIHRIATLKARLAEARVDEALDVIDADVGEVAGSVRSLLDRIRTPLAESSAGSPGERPDALSPPKPLSPGVQRDKMEMEIKTDDKFEAFLEERVHDLLELRKKVVIRLARSSFYGHTIFRILYPDDAAAPPDIVYGDEREKFSLARPRYRVADMDAADEIWNVFVRANPDRYEHYADLELRNRSAE